MNDLYISYQVGYSLSKSAIYLFKSITEKQSEEMVLYKHNWLFPSEWTFKTTFMRHKG